MRFRDRKGKGGVRAAPAFVAAALLAICANGAAADEVMTLQWEGGVIPLAVSDIAAAEAHEGAVAVRLAPGLAAEFARLTQILAGETLAVFVCGREVARPVVRAPIESGRLLVPAADPGATVAVLSGRASCAGFRPGIETGNKAGTGTDD